MNYNGKYIKGKSSPGGGAVYGVCQQPLACWDCGFEFHWSHRALSVSLICCQVEVPAISRSLVQRSPTESGVCLSVICKLLGPLGMETRKKYKREESIRVNIPFKINLIQNIFA
jgi:hypothetical protein